MLAFGSVSAEGSRELGIIREVLTSPCARSEIQATWYQSLLTIILGNSGQQIGHVLKL